MKTFHLPFGFRKMIFLNVLVFLQPAVFGQQDSFFSAGPSVVTLKQVVVRNKLDVPSFIKRVQEDTSFYKAFRNLRVLGYTSLNSIQILTKKNEIHASLNSRSRQYVKNRCRWIQTEDEKSTGDFFDANHNYNYYTADLYASLFLAKDTICGETNIVTGTVFSAKGKSRMVKHREQLKMLFFDPGKKIPGLPFMGNKVALFDEDISRLYDFSIDMNSYKGEMCYEFIITPRAGLSMGELNQVVIKEMRTWFRIENWQIVSRTYSLSYKTLFYDFNVQMEVEMTQFNEYTVPSLLRYNGTWDVPFKKRENAVFTATLFDFNLPR